MHSLIFTFYSNMTKATVLTPNSSPKPSHAACYTKKQDNTILETWTARGLASFKEWTKTRTKGH